MNFSLTTYKRLNTPHPWTKPYSPECIKAGCSEKPLYQDQIYYSLCKDCLEREGLGPFRKRIHKEDYSTLCWIADVEKKLTKKENLQ